ncbi:hypothetical protein DRW03_16920 [Corallococcus sp. H22C18031201]|uniref:sensor histidine kinase n=1 Tax=Citreicoccus inhibens TaxID=2849499 RepID=UPI000E76DEBE|nr:ATP-binding protein [Citreicoccus inhibens]MBU8897342.1 hypothetical protein [Citreicoccus inhibens]RJS21101.1 hypothetical protein DRW03_16920 [Corallococcus sp. H22C18031201]
MTRPQSLRSRMTRFFAGAVLSTLLLYGVLVTVVLGVSDWWEQRHPRPHGQEEALFDDAREALGTVLLTAPFAVVGAVVLGRLFVDRALAPLREASSRARAARASALDLSLPVRGTGDEWDTLASTLNGLLSETRSSLARIRGFTSDAAHELRTPLTVILGETELALRRERSPDEYRRALEIVQLESLGLASLVDALLTLARADSGALVSAVAPVELLQLAEASARRMERVPRENAPRLRVSGVPVQVRGDAVLLGRVFDNLLSNALRHGRNEVRVEVHSTPAGARVAVSDDGPGVEPAFLPRLFERFARADDARSGEGLGLGLALSRALVEAHGGTLSYARLEMHSTVFTVRLPS